MEAWWRAGAQARSWRVEVALQKHVDLGSGELIMRDLNDVMWGQQVHHVQEEELRTQVYTSVDRQTGHLAEYGICDMWLPDRG